MASGRPLLIPLGGPGEWDEKVVGGKAANLAQLALAGFDVPKGFCLTTRAYEGFVKDAGIAAAIRMELGRKSMDDMRWEEIWDSALRIRAKFLAQPLSGLLRETVATGLRGFDACASLAVRSSAVGEDSAGRSFAGLHESIIGVRGGQAVEDAIRLVWASLWSDAALLYRKELGLDPAHSRMAVLVQEMVDADPSGVAFARDPRDTRKEHAIIESVPGPCGQLVDGLVDPDHWELDRKTHGIIAWLPGQRDDAEHPAPLLESRDLEQILETLLSVEQLFGWSPDMEWTGKSDSLTVLQARPITAAAPDEDEKRAWYLSLRPGDVRLKGLRKRVVEQLIPELKAVGQVFAAEKLELLNDQQLADAIEQRSAAVARWKKIYWDDFIPFAHGVRRLATYYNDSVRPEDPYEFVGLLRDQPLGATQRNNAIGRLARQLAANAMLRSVVERLLEECAGTLRWSAFRDALLQKTDSAEDFIHSFEDMNERFLDIVYDEGRLHDQPEPVLRNLIELSQAPNRLLNAVPIAGDSIVALEKRLLDAVGPERHDEALDMIETGRVSWKLRDDDNLLVARLESQLLRALDVAAKRLRALGRLSSEGCPGDAHIKPVVRALREPSSAPITLEDHIKAPTAELYCAPPGETPRQLIGQPASPGVATGTVRCIHGRDDLGSFRQGEVLVCEAIQPTMTHLVPLASAIVERRGGMLIHGAIIARELGIPCVNGVRHAHEILKNGDLVTVDGHLGIVTVGLAEFDLELGIQGT
ncbi:MAG: PEP/pyruvate-binding domain-containing protein [Gammaproteobacteria bacterium]